MPQINCREIAENIIKELVAKPKGGRFLAGVVEEYDFSGQSFQKIKKSAAEKAGIDYRIFVIPKEITGNQEEIRNIIKTLSEDKSCGGIVVQLPLQGIKDPSFVLEAIPPEKDPDALHSDLPNNSPKNKILPPAVLATKTILSSQKINYLDKKIVVVGQGRLVGKPISTWLINEGADVSVAQKGDDLSVIKEADILILGSGEAGLIKSSDLKDGAMVLDFGYAKNASGKISGDFDPEAEANKNITYTPTPGGTGPVLVACLLKNFLDLSC